jgi:hypothetical protein
MAIYNTTFMNNVTNPLDLLVGIGTGVGNSFLIGNLILIAFAIVFLVLAHKQDFLTIIVIDSFLTTILAILLLAAGMIAASIIMFPIIIFIIALIFMFFS